jgi:hypothetical protein
MIMIVIASVLNIVLLAWITFMLLQDPPLHEPATLFAVALLTVTPIINLVALWTIRKKAKKGTELLKDVDVRERLDQIQALLEREADKT